VALRRILVPWVRTPGHCGQTKWPRKKAIAKTTSRIWESMKRTTPTQKPIPIFCSRFKGADSIGKGGRERFVGPPPRSLLEPGVRRFT